MVSSISNSGGLSDTLLVQMRQALFTQIDQNGDGSLSKSELQGLSGKSDSKIDAFIKQLDSDDDNAISQQEFESGLAKLQQQMMPGGIGNAPPPPPPPSDAGTSSDSSSDTISNDLSSLWSALQSGDTTSAQSLLSQLQSDLGALSAGSSSDGATNGTDTSNPLLNDLNTIAKALDSGDLESAQSTFQQVAGHLQGPPPPPPGAGQSENGVLGNGGSMQMEMLSRMIDMISTDSDTAQSSSSTGSLYA